MDNCIYADHHLQGCGTASVGKHRLSPRICDRNAATPAGVALAWSGGISFFPRAGVNAAKLAAELVACTLKHEVCV